jgi:hypothetical protein
MRLRVFLVASVVAAAVALPAAALADSPGTVPGLRAQVTRLITAELHRDTATVCAIVANSGTVHGRTCEQRWGSSLRRFLKHGGRSELRSDMHAVSGAAVNSNGYSASISLPHPLLAGASSFSWYDNCWMLEG